MTTDLSWRAHVEAAFRAGRLTFHWRATLLTLHGYRGTGGIAWPAHATLAERAGVAVSTVQRALTAARDLGLLWWTARRLRVGWRSLRSSNAYRFVVPARPTAPAAGRSGASVLQARAGSVRAVLRALGIDPRTAGQRDGGSDKQEKKGQLLRKNGIGRSTAAPVCWAAEEAAAYRKRDADLALFRGMDMTAEPPGQEARMAAKFAEEQRRARENRMARQSLAEPVGQEARMAAKFAEERRRARENRMARQLRR